MKKTIKTAFKETMERIHNANILKIRGKGPWLTLAAVAAICLATSVHADQISPNPNPAGSTITVTGNDINGTAFNNDGAINVTDTGTLTSNAGATMNNNSGAAITNAGTLTTVEGSVFSNNGTIGNGTSATLNVGTASTTGNAIILNNYGTITNDGTLHVKKLKGGWNNQEYNRLINNVGGTLVNNGHLRADTYNCLGTGCDTWGIIENHGNFYNSATGNTEIGGWLLNGAHLAGPGLLPVINPNATLINDGTMTIGQVVSNSAIMTNNGTLSGTGNWFNATADAVFNNNGTMSLNFYRNSGTLNNNEAGIINTNNGLQNFNGARINNAGTMNIDSAGLYNYAGAGLINTGTLKNTGFFSNAGMLELAAGSNYNFTGGTLDNNGTLILHSSFTLGDAIAGTVNLNTGGTVQNHAALINAAGHSHDNNGTINNNAGGSIVNNGILNNNAGGVLTSSGLFTNNSTLNNAGSFSNNGLLNNASGAAIVSTGTLANNAGATFVNNGTLNTASDFMNNGTFMGNGTTIGNVVNNGTLAPGNSIGTMNITGNFASNPGSIYQVEANPQGHADKLAVSGTAMLNGGTVSVLAESGIYNMQTKYNILTAGSVIGTFESVTSNLAFLTPSLSYDPMNVWLTLSRNSTSFCDVANGNNQSSLACVLDNTHTSPDMINVLNALLGLSADGARHAYDQMSGYVHIGMMEATNYSFNRYVNTISGRMEGSGTPGASFANVGSFLLASRDDAGSDAGNVIVAAVNNMRNGVTRGDMKDASPWGLWAKGYGSLGGRNGNEMSSRYDYRGGGLVIGFDRKINDRLLLGVSGGYSFTKVNLNDLSESGNVSGYQGSIYGAYSGDRFYVHGLAGYGYNRYDTTRSIAFGNISRTATAGYSGHGLSGYVETGYRLPIKSFSLVPMASLQAGSLWRNSFTEDNAGALNLGVESANESSLIGSLGFRMSRKFKMRNGAITPELRLRWMHEFANNDYSLTGVFASDPVSAFNIKGDGAGRDSAVVGLGLTWEIGNNLGLALSYDANISSGRTDHGGMIGLRYRW